VVNLDELVIPENLFKKIPRKMIDKHHVVPIRFHDGVLHGGDPPIRTTMRRWRRSSSRWIRGWTSCWRRGRRSRGRSRKW